MIGRRFIIRSKKLDELLAHAYLAGLHDGAENERAALKTAESLLEHRLDTVYRFTYDPEARRS